MHKRLSQHDDDKYRQGWVNYWTARQQEILVTLCVCFIWERFCVVRVIKGPTPG